MVTDGLRSEAIVSTSKVTTSPPDIDAFAGLYLLEGVPVTMCAVATVAWEGLRAWRFSGECSDS